LSPEEEEVLAAFAGVTVASITKELVDAWWVAKQGLYHDGKGNTWVGGGDKDAELAWELVKHAANLRYGHVS